MKKLLWSIAAVGLLATACSKDEVEEHLTEGVSALATPVGGSAKSNNNGGTWNFHVWNEAYFNQAQGSLWAKRSGNPAQTPTVAASFTVRYEDSGDAISGMFSRVGNSPNYRSANNLFSFTSADDFSLLSLSINWNAADGTPQEESGSIFLYPSGRTVVQDPKVMRVTSKLSGSGEGIIEFNVVLADDPAQEVSSVELRIGDDAFVMEKTHFNQALGLARYGTPIPSGVFTTYGDDSPDVSLTVKTGESYTQAFGAYGHVYSHVSGGVVPGRVFCGSGPCMVRENVDAGMVRWMYEETSDPVILGSKLTSTNNGGTFNLTVAIADLGNWVDDVRYTFLPSEGPTPLADTYQLTLVGEGAANLKVYEVSGIRFQTPVSGYTEFRAAITCNGGGARQCRIEGATTYCPIIRGCGNY